MAAMARAVRVICAPPTWKVNPPEKPRPHTRITAAMIRFRELVKSTRFSTTLRTPMAEIMPYRMKLTPPTMAAGMAFTTAANMGLKDSTRA